MTLSVIIVNYNVKYFLEQCLLSVQKALLQTEGEIIVIDNNSTDGSLDYLQPLFPRVNFVANKENPGFGKACNQGLSIARGEFILFLNPDTIVPEDCFEKCIAFFRSHPDAGALGIKMLDGSGKFLPESKRSFPSPLTSFYKLTGLSALFPKSPVFARYHLGHLDENKDHEIDVLAGAFMLIPKKVLDEVGAFDEVFFMYGEDVDLSYRIQKAGYKNYYFAGSSILHFKGESTRKGSLNYVRMFYKAMSIFVKKHYGGGSAGFFNLFIQLAIWLRGAVSAVITFFQWVGLRAIDMMLILFSFWLMKLFWYGYVRTAIKYDVGVLAIAFPSFTLVFWIAAYYSGLYDGAYKHSKLFRSYISAGLLILAVYSLLPDNFRFSRAIVVLSPLVAYILMAALRQLLIAAKKIESSDEDDEKRQTIIVGNNNEYQNAVRLIKEAGRNERVLGRVSIQENDTAVIGNWNNISTIAQSIPVKEIIFCEGTASFGDIISKLSQVPADTRIKFFSSGSRSIIGSDFRNSSGEFISKQKEFAIATPVKKRAKRLLDILTAILLLLTWPVQLFLVQKPVGLLKNIFLVLWGRLSWIGYTSHNTSLPLLQKSVIGCNALRFSDNKLPADSLSLIDEWYAVDYELRKDVELILKGWKWLGE